MRTHLITLRPDRESAVPRYFFDIVDGDHQVRDEEGLVLVDRETARREAIASLVDLARDELPDGDHRAFMIKVRDTQDHYLLAAKLALDADWIDPDGSSDRTKT